MQVDLDLAKEPSGAQVSRKQACLTLKPDGHWVLANTGRRCMYVNGRPCSQGQAITLPQLSLLQVSADINMNSVSSMGT